MLSDLVTNYEISEEDISTYSFESSFDTSTCEYIAGNEIVYKWGGKDFINFFQLKGGEARGDNTNQEISN